MCPRRTSPCLPRRWEVILTTSERAARTFTAPGKLVLCGEYAVVDGRPAVVAAVDRRARARWVPGAGLRVRGNDPRWLEITPDSLADDALGVEQPLLVAVLREVRRRGHALPSGDIAVDTSAFVSSTTKLGLGSSAAATASFAAAVLTAERAGQPSAEEVHTVARAAHRAFQGGGSGIDVAAACHGGILRFEAGRVTPAPPLPAALALVVAWTGISAKTQGFVDAWRGLADRGRHVDAIHEATLRFLAGANANSDGEVLAAVDDAREAMATMGRAAGIDVVTAELTRIARIARRHGGASKPSGAGGGDIAICLVPTKAREALARDLEDAGFPVLGLHLDSAGVRLEP